MMMQDAPALLIGGKAAVAKKKVELPPQS